MDLQLSGKRAIVTGGSRGIGKAIAQQLAEEGVDVAIAARGREQLDATAREIAKTTGRRVVPIVVEMTDDASVDALVAAAVKALGGIDILVNNAAAPGGTVPSAKIAQVNGADLLFDVNVKVAGYLRAARAVAPHLVSNGWGRIINIGGGAARRTGNYIASLRNAAVSSLTKNLADELGPKGVNVIAIHPGTTRAGKPIAPEAEERANRSISVGRIIDANEIAFVVAFLASPKSIAINGETIATGGGVLGPINY
ncbi:MAG TPA: SDR family oxidoreductase [Stellaceae bacterium]|nr:SDR family oxidoreductase [Stellaceae bacterium]